MTNMQPSKFSDQIAAGIAPVSGIASKLLSGREPSPTGAAMVMASHVSGTPADRRMLISIGVIHDASHVKHTPDGLRRYLTGKLGKKDYAKIKDEFGLDDIDGTVESLLQVASVDPELCVAILEGRIYSAIMRIPPAGLWLNGEELLSVAETMDLIEAVSHLLLFVAVLRAGRVAFLRYYRPTGHAVLDNAGPGRAPTIAHGAKVLQHNANWIMSTLDLYEIGKSRAFTSAEEATVDVPGLVAFGETTLSSLSQLHGDEAMDIVEAAVVEARHHTDLIGHGAAEIRADTDRGKMHLHKMQGEDALSMLWLSCAFAVAWTELRKEQKKLRKEQKKKDVSWLRAAMDDTRAGIPISLPDPIKAEAAGVRKLFFLVRNLIVRDPKSKAAVRVRKLKNLRGDKNTEWASVVDELWDAGNAERKGKEPFSLALSSVANNMYRWATIHSDTSRGKEIVAEAAGPILIQLGV